jgi:DNA-binding transcriptional regulator LsrR (DeoR family)
MTEMIQRAAKLRNDGYATEVISDRLGVKPSTVYNYISAAKADGLLEAAAGNNIANLLRSLPPEVRRWLEAQVPPGSTVTEMIGAIIADAYYEENHVAYPDTGM